MTSALAPPMDKYSETLRSLDATRPWVRSLQGVLRNIHRRSLERETSGLFAY